MSDCLMIGRAKYAEGGTAKFSVYENGEVAIYIMADDGEPVATASVNIPDSRPLEDGEVWLKGWSENEGIPQALVAAGLCELTGETHQLELASALLAKLSPEAMIFVNDMYESLRENSIANIENTDDDIPY